MNVLFALVCNKHYLTKIIYRMKKILLLAVAAIAFMACENQGQGGNSGAPAKDQKALKSVTTEAVDLLGKDAAAADKALIAAGFKQMDLEASNQIIAAPAKRVKALKADGEDGSGKQVMYAYNMPANAESMSEEEANKYLKNLFAKGQFYMVTVVVYVEDKVAAVQTSLLAGVNDNINLTYTEVSDQLYKALPSNAVMKQWQGKLSVDDAEEKVYENHDEYVAAIAKAKAVEAQEQGYAVTSATVSAGLTYVCEWDRPSDAEAATMEQRSGYACTMAAFAIGDLAATQGLME